MVYGIMQIYVCMCVFVTQQKIFQGEVILKKSVNMCNEQQRWAAKR